MDNDLLFNVDGFVRGSMGSGGIGGVLRNACGKVLCLFSSFVGFVDPIVAELLAIHKACVLISTCQLLDDRNIAILSDSESVVAWINRDGFGLLSQVNLIYDIRQILRPRRSLVVKFTPRGSNLLADSLAKAGSNM